MTRAIADDNAGVNADSFDDIFRRVHHEEAGLGDERYARESYIDIVSAPPQSPTHSPTRSGTPATTIVSTPKFSEYRHDPSKELLEFDIRPGYNAKASAAGGIPSHSYLEPVSLRHSYSYRSASSQTTPSLTRTSNSRRRHGTATLGVEPRARVPAVIPQCLALESCSEDGILCSSSSAFAAMLDDPQDVPWPAVLIEGPKSTIVCGSAALCQLLDRDPWDLGQQPLTCILADPPKSPLYEDFMAEIDRVLIHSFSTAKSVTCTPVHVISGSTFALADCAGEGIVPPQQIKCCLSFIRPLPPLEDPKSTPAAVVVLVPSHRCCQAYGRLSQSRRVAMITKILRSIGETHANVTQKILGFVPSQEIYA